MDCMEAKALKSRIRGELAMKPTQQQALFDDFLCANGFTCMPTEDFSLDELLDFSFEELQEGSNDFLVGEEEVEKYDNNSLVDDDNNSSNFGSFSASGDSGYLPSAELSVPENHFVEQDDCVAELEWVSQFVDDSPLELSLLCPPEREEKMKELQNRIEPSLTRLISLPSWGLARARSKRPRISNPVWFVGPPVSSTRSGGVQGKTEFSGEPRVKKAKKKPVVQEVAVQFQRRCGHCGVEKTPQWRTGPMGPKTLCNACGVRFKSGRLFPEYRPACSPTFCSDIHSNSHRKVLEMRKKKEVIGGFEPGL